MIRFASCDLPCSLAWIIDSVQRVPSIRLGPDTDITIVRRDGL
jgi:hypothetical protein